MICPAQVMFQFGQDGFPSHPSFLLAVIRNRHTRFIKSLQTSVVFGFLYHDQLFFHDSTVSPGTSPDSPQILSWFTLFLFFYLSSHPQEPLKLGIPNISAICLAFSVNSGPPGLKQARVNHL